MKRIATLLIVCLGLLVAASTCLAQMYTVTDLGTMSPTGINLTGQVVGNFNGHAYLWTQTNGLQDLGTLVGGTFSEADAINDLGVVAGTANGLGTVSGIPELGECPNLVQPFIWTQSEGMKGLGTPGFFNGEVMVIDQYCTIQYSATGINLSGQVIGYSFAGGTTYGYGFVWNVTDGWKEVFGNWQGTSANGINNSAQIVGQAPWVFPAPMSWKAGVMTSLPMLPEAWSGSAANGVNDLGQVVGWSYSCLVLPVCPVHSVLWTPSGEIHDLGTLAGDPFSVASKINFYGQVVGSSGSAKSGNLREEDPRLFVSGRGFLWSESSGMRDLNTLISPGSGWVINSASDINGWGQIVGDGRLNGVAHGILLTPIYKGAVMPPINADGTSIFSAKRHVLPIRFTLTQYDATTCNLQPATIFVTRIAGGTPGPVDESTYSMQANSGSNFRVDPSSCQYIYHLAASSNGSRNVPGGHQHQRNHRRSRGVCAQIEDSFNHKEHEGTRGDRKSRIRPRINTNRDESGCEKADEARAHCAGLKKEAASWR